MLFQIFKQTFCDADIQKDCECFRVLGPKTPMTKDFRENRVNFAVTQAGVCERVFMG